MKAKTKIVVKEWLYLTLAWLAIVYFYFFITWYAIKDQIKSSVFTEYLESGYSHLELLLFGILFGILFSLVETISEHNALRQKYFGYIIIVKSILYIVSLAIVAVIIVNIFYYFDLVSREFTRETLAIFTPLYFTSFFTYLIFFILLVNFIIQVNKKFGPGILLDFVRGKYHKPREEKRIFMFLDLTGSTNIAEKLGNNTYSQFIRNCFYDLTDIVINYKAHIYQYVGDEVVLSWKVQEGLTNLACFKLFFAFEKQLMHRKSFYLEKYGVFPVFKAGMDVGIVTVAEIGEIKREIAYHGDVLNTAARLEGMCNQLKKRILFSEHLEHKIRNMPEVKCELIGDLNLRGKKEKLKIYSLAMKGDRISQTTASDLLEV